MVYQWFRADNAEKLNKAAIAGATKKQYNSRPEDNGKWLLRVDENGNESNVIGPIAPYPLASVPQVRLATLDFASLNLGTYTSFTDESGDVFTPIGAASFNVVERLVNGVMCKGIDYTGSGFTCLRNTNAAKWKQLHDGTLEYSIFFEGAIGNSADPNAIYALIGTDGTTTANIGFSVLWDDRASQARNNSLIFEISRTGGAELSMINAVVPDAVPANSYTSFFIDYQPSGTTDNLKLRGRRSKVAKANRSLQTPSTANATYNLDIGSGGNGALPFVGIISRIVIFKGIVQDSNKLKIEGVYGAALDLPALDKRAAIVTLSDDGGYNFAGTLCRISSTLSKYPFRAGTGHMDNGRIDTADYDEALNTWSNRQTIFTPPARFDCRDTRMLKIGNNLLIFSSVVNRDSASPDYNKIARYGYVKSTDLGTTWGAYTDMYATPEYGTTWGRGVQLGADLFIQPYWKAINLPAEGTSGAPSAVFKTGFHRFNAAAGYLGDTEYYNSGVGTGFHATENILLNLGGGKLITFIRNEPYWGQVGGLLQVTSSDNGVTWNAPVRMNIGGVNVNVPTAHYDPETDTITVFYQDRVDGWIKASVKNPVSAVFNTPTAWKAAVDYHFNHTAPNSADRKGLGYPDYDGKTLVWAKEDSNTVARLMWKQENFSNF